MKELEKEIERLKCENMALRADNEQLRKDVNRLKTREKMLEKAAEIWKKKCGERECNITWRKKNNEFMVWNWKISKRSGGTFYTE
jgi:regulator of replication initiation timing